MNSQQWFSEIFFVFTEKFAKNVCPRWLRRHSDGVVNDYADTRKTTQTFSENFEGISQILNEQLGEKKLLGCVYNPNRNNFKIW